MGILDLTMNFCLNDLCSFYIVQLNENEFSGQIPTEIGLLSSLQQMWMSFNYFNGTLFDEIQNISTLKSLSVNNNNMTGTLPNFFDKSLDFIAVSHNQFTGQIPPSAFDEDKEFSALLLSETKLAGSVPAGFCNKVQTLEVDDSNWFLDEPQVDCACCEKAHCHLWESARTTAVGTGRPACPESSDYNISFFEEYWVTDLITNKTIRKFHGEGNQSSEICLSPTGCYSMIDVGRVLLDYNLSYSASANALVQQNTCNAVDICGTLLDAEHFKRPGLNHITQLVNQDLFNPSDALCWLINSDALFDPFHICDGTLLQRFILAKFFIDQSDYDFDKFSSNHTCEWPGITCDFTNRFVEQIDLSYDPYILNNTLKGTIMTEIGLLTRLKSINFNGNDLTGSIAPLIFAYMPYLEVFDVGQNKIEGTVSKELFDLPQLREINLSYNFLVGTLPEVFEYPKSLGKSMDTNIICLYSVTKLTTKFGDCSSFVFSTRIF